VNGHGPREAAAKAAELELVYRTAPVGLCFMDCDQRFVRINERLAAINGLPVAAHIGRTLREVIPETAPHVEPFYRQVIESGKPLLDMVIQAVTEAAPREERIYHVSYLPVALDGRILGVNTVVRDITNQKRAESRLIQQGQILGTIGESVILTDLDGIIDCWNPAAERLYGYSAEEAIGRHIELIHPEGDRQLLSEELLAATERDGDHEVVVRCRKKCGTIIFVELRQTAFRDAQGTTAGRLHCSHDVTDRVQLQDELLEVSAHEQRRFGKALHDGTSQELVGLSMICGALVTGLGNGPQADDGNVKLAHTIQLGIERCLGQVKSLAQGLAPAGVRADGLAAALAELATSVADPAGTRCSFDGPEDLRLENGFLSTHLFRIAEEAVSLGLRHGSPARILIRLEQRPGFLRLRVVDDGTGDVSETDSRRAAIRKMRHRASLIGSLLRFERGEDGGGACVTCTVPRAEDGC